LEREKLVIGKVHYASSQELEHRIAINCLKKLCIVLEGREAGGGAAKAIRDVDVFEKKEWSRPTNRSRLGNLLKEAGKNCSQGLKRC